MKQPLVLKYFISDPGDRSAGIQPFTDEITVTVHSGNPPGDPGDFGSAVCQLLREHYDTNGVYTEHEWQAMMENERKLDEALGGALGTGLQKFYVSLIDDMVGAYVEYTATSKDAVRKYLADKFLKGNTWTFRWCSIYTRAEIIETENTVIIRAQCGPLYEEEG